MAAPAPQTQPINLASAMLRGMQTGFTRPRYQDAGDSVMVLAWPATYQPRNFATREVSTIAVPVPPNVMRNYLALFLARAAGPQFTQDKSAVRNWMLSVYNLAFPGIVRQFPMGYNIHIHEIPNAELIMAEEMEAVDDDGNHRAWLFQPGQEGLPEPYGTYETVLDCSDEAPVYSCISVLTFVLGKQPSQANISAFHERRPKALISKYGIPESAHVLLTGDWKPTLVSLLGLHNMWTSNPSLRQFFVKEFAAWMDEPNPSTRQDIIMTSFRLLAWAGMTHLALISEFILAYPAVKEMDLLRPYLKTFEDGLVELRAMPLHMRPFVKLYAGDRLGFLRQQDLRPLIALAVKVKELTTPTLRNYYHDAGQDRLVSTVFAHLGIVGPTEGPGTQE